MQRENKYQFSVRNNRFIDDIDNDDNYIHWSCGHKEYIFSARCKITRCITTMGDDNDDHCTMTILTNREVSSLFSHNCWVNHSLPQELFFGCIEVILKLINNSWHSNRIPCSHLQLHIDTALKDKVFGSLNMQVSTSVFGYPSTYLLTNKSVTISREKCKDTLHCNCHMLLLKKAKRKCLCVRCPLLAIGRQLRSHSRNLCFVFHKGF